MTAADLRLDSERAVFAAAAASAAALGADLRPRSFVAITGASDSGKSTLLRALAATEVLAGRAGAVFADEPTDYLPDAGEFLRTLRRAVDELGLTVVIATHDARAAHLADRVVELREGRIVSDTGGDVGHAG